MKSGAQHVKIRKAVPDDAAPIASVLLASFAEYKPLYTAKAFAATTPTSEQILGRINEGTVWVAVHEDAIVGTVSVVEKGEGLYIRGMAVLPGERGLRIGESLLREVEAFAAVMNVNRLFLSTTPFLDRAIRFYQRFGFERTDDLPHVMFGTPLFTMEKRTKK